MAYDFMVITMAIVEAAKVGEDPDHWPFRQQLIYEDRVPEVWAQICLMAIAEVKGDPILMSFFQIERANGLRRQAANRLADAVDCLDLAKTIIDDLPSYCWRKNRLLELWSYHGGQVYTRLGKFAEAVAAHQVAAQLARSPFGKAIAESEASLERLKLAIVNQEGAVEEFLTEFFWASYPLCLQREEWKHDQDRLRWFLNFAYNWRIWSWFVKNQLPSVEQFAQFGITDLDALVPSKLQPSFAGAQKIVQSIIQLPTNPAKAAAIASSVTPNEGQSWFALALFLQGYAEIISGENIPGAQEAIVKLWAMENDGHVAQACAKAAGL